MPIYLDNAATTQPTPEVCETVSNVMRVQYGNPSSLHSMGLEAERIINEARARVARVLGKDAASVLFTSGGAEANNMAIFGICGRKALGGAHGAGAGRIITTAMEHPTILKPLKEIENLGWEVIYLSNVNKTGGGVGDGSHGGAAGGGMGAGALLERLEAALDGRVELISLAHVNNETGAMLPLAAVKSLRDRLCPGALLHLDCAQSFAKLQLAREVRGVDIISASAHKIHGPKGAGALILSERAKRRIKPLICGGGQEGGLRSGTENTPAIAGFGAAAVQAFETIASGAEHAGELGRALIAGIETAGLEYVRVSSHIDCSPYILTLAFPGIPAEVMLNYLNQNGIYVSSGAACSSKRAVKTGSHVLTALGFNDDIIKSAIRFSFSRFNTLREIAETADRLKSAMHNIKRG